MKTITESVFVLLLLIGCTQNTKNQNDNTIRFDLALEDMEEVMLSEIADSISYIPLQTDPKCLLQHPEFHPSSRYIIADEYVFDWNGKFVRKIGKIGRGPCEEVTGFLDVRYFENKFYSKGNKLLEYDSLGVCTGKERHLYIGGMDTIAVGRFDWPVDFGVYENGLYLYNYPDSVFFFDHAFNVKAGYRVVEPWVPDFAHPPSNLCPFSNNGNSTLFYNTHNDTIFRVDDGVLTPAWILDLGKYKIDNDFYFNKFGELFYRAFEDYQKGNLENAEIVRFMDNKKRIFSVSETEDYLFIVWANVIIQAELRGKEKPFPQVAYYNKHTGKLTVVKGRGFVNDIDSGPPFIPHWGVWHNQLIGSIWPYELKEYVHSQKEKGHPVSKRLQDLSERLADDDNPIVVVVHLKSTL